MAIGKDKERIVITISKEDKKQLQEIAASESRSMSNYISVLIKECIKAHENGN